MIATIVMDACLAVLLLGVGSGMTTVDPRFAAVSGVLALLSLGWPENMEHQDGRLLPGDLLMSFSVIILLGNTRLDPMVGFTGWWPMIVAFVALLSGLFLSVKAWRDKLWLPQRTVMIVVVLLSLSALVVVATLAWAVLKFRSDSGMSPGRMDFFYPLLFWVGLWFGLDSRLRVNKYRLRPGLFGWILDSWRKLAVLLASGIILFSEVVP